MLFMPLSAYLEESAEEKYVSCQAGKDTELDIIQRETKAGVESDWRGNVQLWGYSQAPC